MQSDECEGRNLRPPKADYDPVRRTLFIGRSYTYELTKTKRSDTLPVPSVLVPYLEQGLKTKGPWLCPREDGAQRNTECSPEDNLRSAFRRAGLTTGEWLHKCRRCKRMGRKTPHVVAKNDEKMKCAVPGCNFTLWPTAVPIGLRFHDLRHTTATLLLRAGTPIQHVQRIMRHAQITTTVNTYGHLMTEDLRPYLEQPGPVHPRSKAQNCAWPPTPTRSKTMKNQQDEIVNSVTSDKPPSFFKSAGAMSQTSQSSPDVETSHRSAHLKTSAPNSGHNRSVSSPEVQVHDRSKRLPKGAVVYFAESAGLVKIGCSSDLKNRLKSLRLSSAAPVALLATTKGDRFLEMEIHHHFADEHDHGEWFRLSPRLVETIRRVANGDGSALRGLRNRLKARPYRFYETKQSIRAYLRERSRREATAGGAL